MSSEKEFNEWFLDFFGDEIPDEKVFEIKEDTKNAWDYQQTKLDDKDKEIERLKKLLIESNKEKEDAQLWICENRKWDLFKNRIHEIDIKNQEIERLKAENRRMEIEIRLALKRIGTSFNADSIKEDLKRALREVESE